MSYFYAGYKANPLSAKSLEASFINIVPEIIRKDVWTYENNETFITIYGFNKVIGDFFHEHKDTGSWIAIIGTPLLNLNNEREKDRLVKRFFDDPETLIEEEIDGCWIILAYDGITKKFYACTDYNNTVPIYYASTTSGVYFSSHELPLARYLGSQIDPLGFSMTIHLKLTWGTCTRFKNIKKMLPAQLLVFNGEKEPISYQYWQPSEEEQWRGRIDDIIYEWLNLLKYSVHSFYKESKKKIVMCDITGGEDSRLILSTVHSLDIPFIAVVDGNENDLDVIIAKRLSNAGRFQLFVRPIPVLPDEILMSKSVDIALYNDAYEGFFASCIHYALYSSAPYMNYDYVKYCGAPGGEVFRGSYYLRGKAILPSTSRNIDYIFFTKLKFLLDFLPGLLRFPDMEIKHIIFNMIKQSLDEVRDFPAGIKIDHLLRAFQVCNTGLIFKMPRYSPYASKELTKSIYKIPPNYKKGGRLTKACTEILYPEIAFVKTQKGVPTIRKDILRYYRFIPETISTVKYITRGAFSRVLKWKNAKKPDLNWERNAKTIKFILTKTAYSKWFSSHESMITGSQYNPEYLESILRDAKERKTRFVPTLGRIISQELACRWVYKEL